MLYKLDLYNDVVPVINMNNNLLKVQNLNEYAIFKIKIKEKEILTTKEHEEAAITVFENNLLYLKQCEQSLNNLFAGFCKLEANYVGPNNNNQIADISITLKDSIINLYKKELSFYELFILGVNIATIISKILSIIIKPEILSTNDYLDLANEILDIFDNNRLTAPVKYIDSVTDCLNSKTNKYSYDCYFATKWSLKTLTSRKKLIFHLIAKRK